MPEALRIVVIVSDPSLAEVDEHAQTQAERSRLLRIGLLEAGYNLVATLPADPFLIERLAIEVNHSILRHSCKLIKFKALR